VSGAGQVCAERRVARGRVAPAPLALAVIGLTLALPVWGPASGGPDLPAVLAAAGQSPQDRYVTPRTADGLPDLQGVWQVMNSAAWDVRDHNGALGVPAGKGVVIGGEIPYRPEAVPRQQRNYRERATADPVSSCKAPGVPRITYMPFPFQIFETPEYVLMAYEFGFHQRFIYTDGSAHLDGIPIWMGDSRGRWDGDSLVVDTRNFTGDTWFDHAGNFHSAALRVVERFTRVSHEHLDYEVTIEDPDTFTRPWQMRMLLYRRAEPDAQLLEYACWEHLMYEKGLNGTTPPPPFGR